MAKPAKSKKKQSDEEFPTDWDVDGYRADYESEEHWNLRREFMTVHKEKFPEQRLVCLAAVFTNMEFMGCKYSSEVMQLVVEMAKDVAKDFRERRANKLKRTFVAASDAAEARAKGRRNVHQELEGKPGGSNAGNQRNASSNYGGSGNNYGVQGRNYDGPSGSGGARGGNYGGPGGNYGGPGNNYGSNYGGPGNQYGGNYGGPGNNYGGNYGNQGNNYGPGGPGNYGGRSNNYGGNYGGPGNQYGGRNQYGGGYVGSGNNYDGPNSNYGGQGGHQGNNYNDYSNNPSSKRKHFANDQDQPPSKRTSRFDLFEGLQFGKFVLFLIGGRNCLRTSAQRCNVQYEEKEFNGPGGRKNVEILLNGRVVTSASEENVKVSKATAFNKALDLLQRSCYSIKPNPFRDTIKINKTNNQVVCDITKQQAETLEDKKLDASNKGYKMMKSMGWTGGGLGSQTQGREEPVGYLLKNNRAGLGNSACKLDRSYFTQILKNYIESDDIRELQFEPTFTKDERAMLHEIAGKFNLKSNSYGRDEDRRLVISKKNISNEQILNEILVNKNASYCDKYFVQVPESKARQHPEHTAKLQLDS